MTVLLEKVGRAMHSLLRDKQMLPAFFQSVLHQGIFLGKGLYYWETELGMLFLGLYKIRR